MPSLSEKIEAAMAELQATVVKYNETLSELEKIKTELFTLQGGVNALKSLQESEEIEEE